MFNKNVIDGNYEGVKKDLDSGVINLNSKAGRENVSAAIINMRFNILKLFVNRKPDIFIGDDLVIACAYSDIDIVKLILNQKIDINYNDGSPLIRAVSKNLYNNVKLLISRGADITIKKNAPIQHAAINGNLDIVKLLCFNGADRHVFNDSPLAYAAYEGYSRVVDFFLSFDDVNVDKCDALVYSVNNNHLKISETLIDYGFIPNESMLNNAMLDGNLEICKLLKKHGVMINDNFLKNSVLNDNIKDWCFSFKKDLKAYNTDGRLTCFKCGGKLKQVVGFTGSNLNYCPNCES